VQRLFVQRAAELMRDELPVEEGGCREWSPRGNALVSLPTLFTALRAERKVIYNNPFTPCSPQILPRTDNCPQPKKARPQSHALTTYN
jgi:hypothetical protein